MRCASSARTRGGAARRSSCRRSFLQERPGRTPALWLAAGRRRYEVGTALNEREKRDLAEALGLALHRLRHPVFDNPQLRPAPEAA